MKKNRYMNVYNEEMVSISRAEYEEFQAQREKISELEKQVELLMEAIRLSRKKQYGSSSEKTYDDGMEQLSLLFDEAEVYAEEEAKEEPVSVVEAHTRRKKHEYALDKLPEGIATEVVEHKVEDASCPVCGEAMTEIGKEVVRTLKLIPAKAVVVEHVYYSYACKNCEKENTETPVIKTPHEQNIIPGSFATAEAIAHIMTQKFVVGFPLYRQEQELKRQGISLSRQTMSNWILKATEDYFVPVYDELHKELIGRDILHADETTLQVLNEPGRKAQSKSYMWLYRTSGDTDKPIVLYEYQPSRGGEHPKRFLEGYTGYLHTDGYEVYHNLPEEIRVVGCWAHARRKFDEALKSQPKANKTGLAAQGLEWCNKLFEIEKKIKDLPFEDKYNERLGQAKPVLDAMWSWANSRTVAPKSALGKAMTYLREQWPYLCNYLLDGRLEISNNRAERSIKPFVIDRKNFLFANTPGGAQGSAVMFSLIQTAIENNIDPYKYLVWVMKKGQKLKDTDKSWAEKLLPEKYMLECGGAV